MSIALLAPLGLAALAALALPLIIHLVRRIELRTTEFAALRWISERIRPRRRLRFERPWLLLLRLVLLAAMALLLARPILDVPPGSASNRVLVAPGSDIGAARAAVTLRNADWRWLAPGFPALETPAPSASVPTASLLREADADLPRDATLAVVVPEIVSGLDGERPKLSREVEWHVVPGRMPDRGEVSAPAAITLAVRYAPAAEPTLRYLRAAIAALDVREPGRYALDAQPGDVAVNATTRDLLWLGAPITAAIAAWIEAGGTALVDGERCADGAPAWRDASGDVLARIEPRGRGRMICLSAALSPQTFPALLDAGFPQHLADLLQGDARPPSRGPADALRPAGGAPSSRIAATAESAKPLDPWLVLAIALGLLIERVVATRAPKPVT